MKTKAILVVVMLSVVNVVAASTTDIFGTGVNQFTIDFVDISGDSGDLGSWSAGEDYTFSGVNHGDYRMGVLEISNDQYAKFTTNNPDPEFSGGDVPANQVTWFEAAKFTNFLNTSTGNQAAYKFTADVMGVWEDGDYGYDASNPYRNRNAKYFLPTEDEWVKAAYWNGTSLQDYATKAGESLTQGDGTSGTGWNYKDGGYATDPYGLWDVGSGSEELNGTYDMMGNVWEWTESNYSGVFNASSNRLLRGGSYNGTDFGLSSSNRYNNSAPSHEYNVIGFRVASDPHPIPAPSAVLLGSMGCGIVGWLKRRRSL